MKHMIKFLTSAVLALIFVLTPISELTVNASDAGLNPIPGRENSTSGTESPATTTTGGKSKKISYAKRVEQIKEYAKTNKEIKGWLTIPGTDIDNPVALGGKDNNYYANRNWKGEEFKNNTWKNYVNTVDYLDFRTKIGSSWNNGSRNFVIYGHNWTNLRNPMVIGKSKYHDMFGQLPSYTSIDFYRENPYIYFSTGENEGVWKVFSVAYVETDPKVFNYNSPNPSDETFANMIKEYKARSLFTTNVDVKTTDKLLTLSTCTRRYDNVYDDQRFVVVARLLRSGESEEDAITISKNEKVKEPTFK